MTRTFFQFQIKSFKDISKGVRVLLSGTFGYPWVITASVAFIKSSIKYIKRFLDAIAIFRHFPICSLLTCLCYNFLKCN